ncbi:cobalt ABC transporter permease [Pseudoroseicyclus tamaricis]|uniref:Cobalt ABC transporter permease n=1 Tax=Pseudoroseicyclus tamaricis TaxID=2705421 RepID=A0A6B2K1M5_9RHOB|nr:cobalt ABC transporter permease [Pseudoroseicyclus tamaricis]NDV00276.1 cobalt ABC transporter permease [Pseudoroseicyclus tamaricis]
MGARLRRLGLAALAAGLWPLAAPAHNLILEAYVIGEGIEGEAFFSDGTLVGDIAVEVLGPGGEALGEAVTDANGAFTFAPTEGVDHLFRLDAGSGHVAEALVAAADLPGALAPAAPVAAEAPAPASEAPAGSVTAEAAAALVAERLRAETRPVRQDWAIYSAHTPLPVALGGIGYILGLSGLCYFIMAWRRKRRFGAGA